MPMVDQYHIFDEFYQNSRNTLRINILCKIKTPYMGIGVSPKRICNVYKIQHHGMYKSDMRRASYFVFTTYNYLAQTASSGGMMLFGTHSHYLISKLANVLLLPPVGDQYQQIPGVDRIIPV